MTTKTFRAILLLFWFWFAVNMGLIAWLFLK